MQLLKIFTALMAVMVTGSSAAAVSKANNFLTEGIGLDVCVLVKAPLEILVGSAVKDFGTLDLCLCLSGIPNFIDTNAIAVAAVETAGYNGVLDALTLLVDTGRFSPCTPSGSSKVKRDRTLADARCPLGLSICGVESGRHGAWECVDTMRDLESCGGCSFSFMGHQASGRDCTDIRGVEDVACNDGACEVFSCRLGYEISQYGTSCDKIASKPERPKGYHQVGANL